MSKSIYLIKLLKTKDELEKIIVEREIKNPSPILKDKLANLRKDLEEEIYSIQGENKFQFYFLIVAIEILIVFNNVGNALINEPSYKNQISFFEGVLNSPISRITLILIVFIIASLITMRIGRKLKPKLEEYWKYNLAMLGIYNAVLVSCILALTILLTLLDPIVPAF